MPTELTSSESESSPESSPENSINTRIIEGRNTRSSEKVGFGPELLPHSIKQKKNSPKTESPKARTERHKTPAPIVKFKSNETNWKKAAAIGFVLISMLAYYFLSSNVKSSVVLNLSANCSKFLDLQRQFPNQDKKLFKSLKTGVEATANGKPPEPTVFSFFSTDQIVMQTVIKEIIKATQECMNQNHDPISLNKDQLSNKMVEDYKEELSIRNIMIINNVEEASPSAVTSLHSFCDTENPVVKKSIIFLTLKVPHSPKGKPVEYITDYLNDRWETLDYNIREPLIARMVDQTFFLKP